MSTAILLIRPYNAVSSVCVCVCDLLTLVVCQPERYRTVFCYITSQRRAPALAAFTLYGFIRFKAYFPGSKFVGGTAHTVARAIKGLGRKELKGPMMATHDGAGGTRSPRRCRYFRQNPALGSTDERPRGCAPCRRVPPKCQGVLDVHCRILNELRDAKAPVPWYQPLKPITVSDIFHVTRLSVTHTSPIQ